jgi:hypothetical protein
MLPIMHSPKYTATLPSTKSKIEFKPFVVKQEKVLLMALEGGDQGEIIRAILNLLDECIVTKKINVYDLPTFDVEYIFLKVRSKSVGEEIEMMVRHSDGDAPCTKRTQVVVPLDKVKVKGKISSGKISLTETIGIKLNYPSFKTTYSPTKIDVEEAFNIIYNSVDYVWDENDVYRDFNREEMIDWVGSLNKDQFKRIMDFLETTPKLSHSIKWKCEECGKDDRVLVEGLTSFFISR